MAELLTERACPDCGQAQEWCERPDCLFVPGHWSHATYAGAAACTRIGDRNRDSREYVPPEVQGKWL